MTALYAILAIICIGGILMGAYLIGFDDGAIVENKKLLRRLALEREKFMLEIEIEKEKKHALTHADMVQMETEAINKKEQDQQ